MFPIGTSRQLRLCALSAAVLAFSLTSFAQNGAPASSDTPSAPSASKADTAKPATPELIAGEKSDPKWSPKDNFKEFTHETFSTSTVIVPAALAGLAMTSDTTKKIYGTGADAYGQVFGQDVADNVDGKFFRAFLFPTMFEQVESYQRLGSGHGFGARLGHAFAHSFVTKTRFGNTTLNMSSIPASWAVAGIGNAYYPDEKTTPWATAQRAAWQQAGYTGNDLLSEFAPKMCSMLHLACAKRKD